MFPLYLYNSLLEAYHDYKDYKLSQQAPTRDEMFQKEERLLTLSKLVRGKDYHLIDVPYKLDGKHLYIHTFISKGRPDMNEFQENKKNGNKTVLVMLHGYGGSLAQYYKNYPDLIERFKVYSIDLPGMAQSSKKKFNLDNYEKTLHYFVDSLEEWRKVLGLKKFIILGHSFGGYIATRYAAKYPTRIIMLFLLSPAGTTQVKEDDLIVSKELISQKPWYQKSIYKMLEGIWNNKMTPQTIYNQWYGPILVNQYLTERFDLKDDELELIHDYSVGVLKVPEGSEKGLYQLFDLKHFPQLEAKVPIEIVFDNVEFEFLIVFLFGETDWVVPKGAHNLKKKFEENVKIYTVENAGHQISLDNPERTNEILQENYQEILLKNQKNASKASSSQCYEINL